MRGHWYSAAENMFIVSKKRLALGNVLVYFNVLVTLLAVAVFFWIGNLGSF